MTRDCFQALQNNIWHSNIQLVTKIRLLNVYGLPVLLYGAETWSLTSVLEKKLDACQQWCLRRLLRISHLQRVCNTEVLRRINQTQLSMVLRDRRLRLFGHVATRSDVRTYNSRALRAVISVILSHWGRPPGWPRQSWTRTVEKDLSALSIGLHTAWRRAQDREQCQRTAEAAMLHHGTCPWWWWWWWRWWRWWWWAFDWCQNRWPRMTTNDVNGRYFALFYRVRQLWGPITSKWSRTDPYFLW